MSKELAQLSAGHMREIHVKDMRPIVLKYFSGEELTDFYDWLAPPEGRAEFEKRLRPAASETESLIIRCPYCGTEFRHNGKPEPQVCPGCGAELLGNNSDAPDTRETAWLSKYPPNEL